MLFGPRLQEIGGVEVAVSSTRDIQGSLSASATCARDHGRAGIVSFKGGGVLSGKHRILIPEREGECSEGEREGAGGLASVERV